MTLDHGFQIILPHRGLAVGRLRNRLAAQPSNTRANGRSVGRFLRQAQRA
jgi:hypothetical protein